MSLVKNDKSLPLMIITSEHATRKFEEYFGFTVTITSYAEMGMVEMDEETYAWFLLKWSNQ
jgi:hypothetical protein